MHLRIEQDRTHCQPHGDIDSADERHVDRSIRHLRRGTGEIDRQLVPLLRYPCNQSQLATGGIGIIEKAVDLGLG